jgi:hypothetical protein
LKARHGALLFRVFKADDERRDSGLKRGGTEHISLVIPTALSRGIAMSDKTDTKTAAEEGPLYA